MWHQQNPAWLFMVNGAPMTPTPENKALLLQRLDTHIRAVVSHFGDDISSWDVVNEVIDPAQPGWFPPQPLVRHHGHGVHRPGVQGRAGGRPAREALHQRLQHDRRAEAHVPAEPGQRSAQPRRADRRDRPPDAQQHRVPVSGGGDHNVEPVHGARSGQPDHRARRRDRGWCLDTGTRKVQLSRVLSRLMTESSGIPPATEP